MYSIQFRVGIMDPTNGKNINSRFESRTKAEQFIFYSIVCFRAKSENLQTTLQTILNRKVFLFSFGKINDQNKKKMGENMGNYSWRPYPFRRNDYRCAKACINDTFV